MATALVLLSKPVAGASSCKCGVIRTPKRMAASGARSSLILVDGGCIVGRSSGETIALILRLGQNSYDTCDFVFDRVRLHTRSRRRRAFLEAAVSRAGVLHR